MELVLEGLKKSKSVINFLHVNPEKKTLKLSVLLSTPLNNKIERIDKIECINKTFIQSLTRFPCHTVYFWLLIPCPTTVFL